MRHLKAGRKLNRSPEHRASLMRNLARALITHERIITTVPKAKEARRFVEKLITLAKKGTLHHRRLAIARLHDKEAVKKLFNEIGPRFADRPGGYTRVIKRHERRLGDAGETAFLELLKAGETKVRAHPAAPAPRVTAPTEEAPPAPPREETPPPPREQTPQAESSAPPAEGEPPTEGEKKEENPPAQ